jgi:hypothetical protein
MVRSLPATNIQLGLLLHAGVVMTALKFSALFILSSIWHVGGDVYQTDDRRIRPRFGNYGSPVAMRDKNAGSILKSKDALGSIDIFLERRLGLLHDADVVTILDKNVVDAFPAGTVGPGTVNQNNIPNATLFVLC